MKLVLSGLLAVVFVAGGPAAVAQTWQFSNTNGPDTPTYGGFCVGAAPSSDCDGYDTWRTYTDTNIGDSTDWNLIRVEGWSASEEGAGNFVQALAPAGGVKDWSGLGVDNGQDSDDKEGKSPEHALDNVNRRDFLLVAFEKDWVLDQVEIGWKKSDADLTVLYYDEADAAGTLEPVSVPTHPAVFNESVGLDVGSGVLADETLTRIADEDSPWKVLNHYAVKKKGSVDLKNTGDIASSYWLIAAYVPELSHLGECVVVKGNCGSGADHVKIASIVGAAPPGAAPPLGEEVPEPPTALLLALGVPLLLRLRRN